MAFAGNWVSYKTENMEKFILAAGGQADRAKNAEVATTKMNFVKDGDTFVVSVTGPKGNTIEQRFKPGQQFTEAYGPIGKERQAIASVEGNRLTIKGVDAGTVVVTREVNGDEMVASFSKSGVDVVGKRYFKRA
ncbi:fatty acid-binding protein, liver-like [Glandiceps talaboti]